MVVGDNRFAWQRLDDGSGERLGYGEQRLPCAERPRAGEHHDLRTLVEHLRRPLVVRPARQTGGGSTQIGAVVGVRAGATAPRLFPLAEGAKRRRDKICCPTDPGI